MRCRPGGTAPPTPPWRSRPPWVPAPPGPRGGGGAEVPGWWARERAVASGQHQLAAEAWTRPLLTMSEQLSLVLLLLLALGIIFELPLVMALLAALGLVKAMFLMKYQR